MEQNRAAARAGSDWPGCSSAGEQTWLYEALGNQIDGPAFSSSMDTAITRSLPTQTAPILPLCFPKAEFLLVQEVL